MKQEGFTLIELLVVVAIIGILAAFICYYMVGFVKNKLKIDDTLDVFAVHGVGVIRNSFISTIRIRKIWRFRSF